MDAVNAVTLEGDGATLSRDAVEAFRERLHGRLLTSGDDGYDEARTVWNAMIDRRPALIARCTGMAGITLGGGLGFLSRTKVWCTTTSDPSTSSRRRAS